MIDPEATQRFMAAPWLGEVAPDDKRAILASLVEGRAPARAILLEQDQPNDHLSFLIAGTAQIERTFENGSTRGDHHDHGAVGLRHDVVLPARAAVGGRPRHVRCLGALAVSPGTRGAAARESPGRRGPGRGDPPRLSERFDLMDRLLSEYFTRHRDETSRTSEWSSFRARLFDESGL